MRKNTLFLLAFLILLSSCSRKDETVECDSVIRHTFDIQAELPGIEQDAQSKGYMGSFIAASWSKGDEVSVVNLTQGTVLGGSLTANSEGNSSSFSGTVTGKIQKNDILALLYPAFDNAQEQSFTPFKFDLSGQSAGSKVSLLAYSTFTASDINGSFSGLHLRFTYMLSYLKLNMNNLPPFSSVEKIVVKKVPSSMTVSINSTKDGFLTGTEEERKCRDRITISGDNHTNQNGALYAPLAVMPSDTCSSRTVVVSIVNKGNYSTQLTSSEFSNNKYYNTIIGDFEKITISESQDYGTFLMDGTVIDAYDKYQDELSEGTEGNEHDFTIFNSAENAYWMLRGIPSDADEGDAFTARFYSYGIPGIRTQELSGARVVQMEDDGEFSKLWIKADEYLFIVRK